MRTIEELFVVHRARSGLFSEYEPGETPYVGNGFRNNAVVGMVTPLVGDKVFTFKGIAISAFCEATVQIPPFVACGRSGNGLVVLEPRKTMTGGQLAYVAAYINLAVRWRFSWYRQTTADRLKTIQVPEQYPRGIRFPVADVMPVRTIASAKHRGKLPFKSFALGDLYDLVPGTFHNLGKLASGGVPVVSCGDAFNGVSGFFDVAAEHTYEKKLTVAFNGMNTLTAKYHPYRFATKDDVAVCLPKRPIRTTTELFVQGMLNRERWRYSYYRKCFVDKLRRFMVSLPATRSGELDEDAMQSLIQGTPYWSFMASKI